MKRHLGFTIHFLFLLITLPVIMFVEMTRDIRQKPEEQATSQEVVAFSSKKTPASSDATFSSLDVLK